MRIFPPTYPVKPYTGIPYAVPIPGLRPQGSSQPVPACAPLRISWAAYGGGSSLPNLGVLVNTVQAAVNSTFERISAVFIDNMDSAFPVYVVFPDTGFTVVAAPYKQVFLPVATNDIKCIVYCIGMLDNVQPTTIVGLLNFWLPGFENSEYSVTVPKLLASAEIAGQTDGAATSIFTPGFISPAAGDQYAYAEVSQATPGLIMSIIPGGTYTADQFIIINAVHLSWYGTSAGARSFLIALATNFFVPDLFVWRALHTGGGATTGQLPLVQLTGLNWRWPAGFGCFLRVGPAGVPASFLVTMGISYTIAQKENA